MLCDLDKFGVFLGFFLKDRSIGDNYSNVFSLKLLGSTQVWPLRTQISQKHEQTLQTLRFTNARTELTTLPKCQRLKTISGNLTP